MGEDKAVSTEVRPEKPKNNGVALTGVGFRSLVPKDFSEAEHIAMVLAKSDIVPKEFVGKPANILLAIMYGNEIGLAPAQALQNIMVVNGRPSMWGDAVLGKVKASSVYEASRDSFDEKTMTATFSVKRKGEDWLTRTFSQADAVKANLWGKAGPWQGYPKRMLFNRARAWALRDAFPDVLKGLRIAEEEQDIIEVVPVTGQADQFAMPTPRAETQTEQSKPEETEQDPAQAPTDGPKTVQGVIEKMTKYDGGAYLYIDGAKFYSADESIIHAGRLAKEQGRKVEIAYEDTKDGHVISEVRLLDQEKQ